MPNLDGPGRGTPRHQPAVPGAYLSNVERRAGVRPDGGPLAGFGRATRPLQVRCLPSALRWRSGDWR